MCHYRVTTHRAFRDHTLFASKGVKKTSSDGNSTETSVTNMLKIIMERKQHEFKSKLWLIPPKSETNEIISFLSFCSNLKYDFICKI